MSESVEAQPIDRPRGKRPVDAAAVAWVPAPGTVVPTAFAFSSDGKTLTYLDAESPTGGRVLWKYDATKSPALSILARPPQGGDTDTNVSQAEALRRERMRQRDTGITQIARAAKADIAVIPLLGDLYLLRGDKPLERLTNTPAPEIDPKPSPDGSKIAFVRDDELFVIDLETRKETQLTHGAAPGLTHGLAEFAAQEEMNRFTGYWWSPEGGAIAYQKTDERHIPLFSIVHQGTDKWTVETHRYPFAGEANAKVSLWLKNVAGGGAAGVPLVDPEAYLARVNWNAPENFLFQALSRDQKTLTLWRMQSILNGPVLTKLLTETADTWVNLHDDLHLIEKTGEFVWSSERTGSRHLELRDHDGKLIRVLTSGDRPIDAVLAVDQARREVWFAASLDDPREAHVYRVSLDGGKIETLTKEPGTHKATVSPDGNQFVDIFSDRDHPPVTSIRDRAGNIRAILATGDNDPRVGDVRLIAPVLSEFRNRDGVTLYGAYYAARSKAMGEKAPLIVMVYGGPHVQNVTDSWAVTADLTAQFLAERGFAVWKCDNRGSSRRGHVFESALNRNMGSVEVRDQIDGVKFVAASWPEVDTSRVGVTGRSYGGYMTLRCLTEAPEVFKAGVSVAPVTDWDGYDTCYTERYMGTPKNNPKGYHDSSVLTTASKLEGDLLLVHGLLDENVHYRHTARLMNALIAAGKPFDSLTLPDSRHGTRKQADRKYLAERMGRFFEESLGSAS